MKKSFASVALSLLLLVPGVVFAHATPVALSPDSGAQLSLAPKDVSIRFSERLEQGSSRIRVSNETGERVETGAALVGADGYTLTIPAVLSDGIFTVAWSVVSKDDGHFTRGSFAFSVGSKKVAASSDTQVVQIASMREAVFIAVEFVGNSILWGICALLLLSRFDRRLSRVFAILAVLGALIGCTGAGAQIVLKSLELASLHEIAFRDAVSMYGATAAGFATIVRGAALLTAGFLSALVIARSTKAAAALLACGLLVFAYFRATISHATANPFYPEFSIFVNFVHVIEKDLWLGVLGVTMVLMFTSLRTQLVPELMPRVFRMLSANLVILIISAGYIVWLHLKDISNITGSSWGEVFLQLMVSAVCLVALHSYHVFFARSRPDIVRRHLPVSLAAQTAVALLVVYFSSVVIITSPPPHDAARIFTERSQGTQVALEKAPYEDGMALVTVNGEGGRPLVIIGESEGGLQPELAQRFMGGYVFPVALFGTGDARVEIIVPRETGYDVHAVFSVHADDFKTAAGHGRTFDLFTLLMIMTVVCGVVYALVLTRIASRERMLNNSPYVRGSSIPAFVLVLIIVLNTAFFVSDVFANIFKIRCESEGNAWHIMQPTKAGVTISGEAREGCMLYGGQYHLVDAREYAYLRSLPPAEVTLDSDTLYAGKSSTLTIALKESDGSPAHLAIEHERLLHVVIVSEDMRSFAHVHADDSKPLDARAIDESVFSIEHSFPEAGTYIVGVDYLHGLTHESRTFTVEVEGTPPMSERKAIYYAPSKFDGYSVSFDYVRSFVGNEVSLSYTIRRDGKAVTDLEPYLGAAMHVAVVKTDLTQFLHGHGEVHPPGYVYTPDSSGVHVHAPPPPRFGPNVDAHLAIPEPGFYTVYGEFKHEGKVVVTKFTLHIE